MTIILSFLCSQIKDLEKKKSLIEIDFKEKLSDATYSSDLLLEQLNLEKIKKSEEIDRLNGQLKELKTQYSSI